MNALTDREIYNASAVIDKALLAMNRSNRGEVSSRILAVVRNLNDHIADKVWSDCVQINRWGYRRSQASLVRFETVNLLRDLISF